jgi:hypothetical protein
MAGRVHLHLQIPKQEVSEIYATKEKPVREAFTYTAELGGLLLDSYPCERAIVHNAGSGHNRPRAR